MLRSFMAITTLTVAVAVTPAAQAVTYEAFVEDGNVIALAATAKKGETGQCVTGIRFLYTDPKDPIKRQTGLQICSVARPPLVPGKRTIICRSDYPGIKDIEIKPPVEVGECPGVPAKEPLKP